MRWRQGVAGCVVALALSACRAEPRKGAAPPPASGLVTVAVSTSAVARPAASAEAALDVRAPPATTPLPATRSLGAGILASWLDDQHALFVDALKNDVVSIDVRSGRRKVLSDFVGVSIAAGDAGWATADESGLIHVYDSAGKPLWDQRAGSRGRALAVSARGVVVAGGGVLRSLDSKGNVAWQQKRDVTDGVVSSDARWLAVRNFDDPVVVLRAADGAIERTLDGVVCAMAFSHDGSKLALAITSLDAKLRYPRGPTIVYDTSSWAPLLKIGGRGGCGGIAFSPDDSRVAVHGDELLSIWPLGPGDAVAWTLPTGVLLGWGRAGLLLWHSEQGLAFLAQ